MGDFVFPSPGSRRKRSPHDQLFKELLGAFLPDFLRLTTPEAAGRLDLSCWRLLDKEAFTDWPRGRRRELDLVAEVNLREGGRTALVHVEVEVRARPGAGLRLAEYYMQLRLRHSRPVLPILLCLRRGRPGPGLDELRRFLLAHCVETYLELEGRDAEEFEVLWSREPNREARTMFMTWSERLEAKGFEQGIERGVEQIRRILLRQLSLRFGSLPASVRQRVEAIRSVDRLTRIAEQVLMARSLDEIDLR